MSGMTASASRKKRAAAKPETKVEVRFQPAKNRGNKPHFLPIVAKPPEPKLTRVAFKVSRLMEFCSARELQNQTGHSLWSWPLVVAKELMDNGLDACEEAEVAPEISVIVEKRAIVVQDNAGGISAETIESILDYTIRVSSREAYVSPTRGAQGNALKTILAMGYVFDREFVKAADPAGVTIIESRGVRHRIKFKVDHINNQPQIIHTKTASPVTLGTRITIQWPVKSILDYAEAGFRRLVESYVWFNLTSPSAGSGSGRSSST
jgi:hypothetical protein